jgi:hypothetical protein
MICDGCNVREPHEHRCHEDRCTVDGEPVEGTCACAECHPTVESLMREYNELDIELSRERGRNGNLENADRLLGELLAVIHGDGGHHRQNHGDDESVKAAFDIINDWRLNSGMLKDARAALRHIARTCVEDPDTASFACAASFNPPTALAPETDYVEE